MRELLVSILAGYYIGTFVFIDKTYVGDSPFKLRPIKGVKGDVAKVVEIVLDGQQRITSLFYAKNKPNYPLKGRKNPHIFFIDLEKVREENWDNAVIAVSTTDPKRLKEVYSKATIIEFSDLFKPVSELYELVKNRTNDEFLTKLALEIADKVKGYDEFNIYYIDPGERVDRIVEIFERINRTGTPLSVFDLLVARLFKYGIRLRDLLRDSKERYEVLREIDPEYVIKTMVLIRGKAPTRKNMLYVEPEGFKEDWGHACEVLELAYRRLLDTKMGYGILDFKKWVPYETMIVPLAAMIHYLKTNNIDYSKNYRKLDAWYWVSVFGNRYEHSTDTVSKQDYVNMIKWFNDDSAIPDFIQEFKPEEIDYDVSSQRSAIFRGVISLIVLKGAKDFETGQSPEYEKEKIQIDHIFPISQFRTTYTKEYLDSVLNRTIISSNQRKSNKKPSEFFKDLIEKHGKEYTIEILETHLIPEEALESLLNDNLEEFKEKRKNAIIKEIVGRVLFFVR